MDNLPVMALLAEQQLGRSHQRIRLLHKEEHRLACRLLTEQASRSLAIFTYDLDAELYDQEPFLEAVKRLALRSPKSSVRLLLQNNERVQKQGHRLLELTRRLTSKIEIRRPHSDYLDYLENFLLADTTGYVRRANHQRYEGESCFGCRLETTRKLNLFEEIWACSEPDSALRRLYL